MDVEEYNAQIGAYETFVNNHRTELEKLSKLSKENLKRIGRMKLSKMESDLVSKFEIKVPSRRIDNIISWNDEHIAKLSEAKIGIRRLKGNPHDKKELLERVRNIKQSIIEIIILIRKLLNYK
ncbi:MAG: hypothetical protein QF460_02615 [Candidatus Nanoarchaeia archaeon]|jgi:hypothetical protein|nr:hypothetical protein [Candidatus Nanoarchaeia archaeon]|tara:strand:- start:291 stop:659 length:369 start_codon:yes stop_codon:yes gene_type:complete